MDFGKMFLDVKAAVMRPSSAARDLANRATLTDGLIVFVVSGVIAMIASVVLGIISMLAKGVVSSIVKKSVIDILAAIIGAVVTPFFSAISYIFALPVAIVLSVIQVGMVWFIGKQFGGRADFSTFYGAMAYPIGGFTVLYAIFAGVIQFFISIATGFNPLAGALVSLVSLLPIVLVGCVGLAYQVIFTREIHRIGTGQALIAVLVPIVLFTAITVAFVLCFAAMFAASFAVMLGALKL